MATNLRRFTISVTPAMDEELDKLKQKHYYKATQNDMIRDILTLGLAEMKKTNMLLEHVSR